MLQIETYEDTERDDMVRLTNPEPVAEYEIRDCRGLPIGKVVMPERRPTIGRGAGTVLLVRGQPGRGAGPA